MAISRQGGRWSDGWTERAGGLARVGYIADVGPRLGAAARETVLSIRDGAGPRRKTPRVGWLVDTARDGWSTLTNGGPAVAAVDDPRRSGDDNRTDVRRWAARAHGRPATNADP